MYNLYLQNGFLANSIPCNFHSLQFSFLVDLTLSFLTFSVFCKFHTLPKSTIFLPFSFPCKFLSLQSEATRTDVVLCLTNCPMGKQ